MVFLSFYSWGIVGINRSLRNRSLRYWSLRDVSTESIGVSKVLCELCADFAASWRFGLNSSRCGRCHRNRRVSLTTFLSSHAVGFAAGRPNAGRAELSREPVFCGSLAMRLGRTSSTFFRARRRATLNACDWNFTVAPVSSMSGINAGRLQRGALFLF